MAAAETTSFRPSWPAGHGDEAEHMGEIYEKRGKKDEAIRYYIFSLISDNPTPTPGLAWRHWG